MRKLHVSFSTVKIDIKNVKTFLAKKKEIKCFMLID